MPSLEHEAPLEVIRQQPEVVADLLRRLLPKLPLPDRVTGTLGSADMSQVAPTQYVADTVVVLTDEQTRKPVLAVVIEPQGRDRKTKKVSWPVYLTTAIKANKVPRAILVVLCWDPREADRCRRVIRTGHPGFDLAPVVIDSGAPPGRDDTGGPYLTAFAASMGGIDMETEPGARRVLDAIASPEVSEADRLRMTAIILTLASDAARHLLEAMMTTSEYEKTLAERIHDQGMAEGEAKGEAKALLRLLAARGLAPSEAQRNQVTSCTDAAQLDLWFDRAVTVGTAAEVFAD